MVWFTGEGFDFADARQFDGSILASMGNVIVATVQYRVGVFGFLNDGTVGSGNQGLWDQIEALRWIKNNIKAFGGDVEKITVFGRLSGSMSISLLLASPQLAKEILFERAILMSGVAVGDWVLERQPNKFANQFMKRLACENSTECLMTLPAEHILEKASFGWKPSVDNVMIQDEPLRVFEKGQLANGVTRVMVGSTENDGVLCLLRWFAGQPALYNKIIQNLLSKKDIIKMVISDLKLYKTGSLHQTVERNIGRYFNRKVDTSKYRQNYLRFCSSLLVHSHTDKLAKVLAEKVHIPVLSYRLQYKPSFSLAPDFVTAGAYGDDVILAFGLPFASRSTVTEKDLDISRSLVKLVTSFAWNGNAVPRCEKNELFLTKIQSSQKIFITDNYVTNNTRSLSCQYEKSNVNFVDERKLLSPISLHNSILKR